MVENPFHDKIDMSDNPQKLGKFIIDAELGKGSMGTVYRAVDPYINRTVALKTISRELLADLKTDTSQTDTIITRFKREAQAAWLLNHPNIVSVYEYGEDRNTAFIAMEFVQGRSLKEIFDQNERFDMNTIINLMSQILGALAYSHKHGIVHRDIKPANIIIMPDGQVKITDFGIAHIESSNLTQTGMMLGTPHYMSPEQFMGQPVDGRSDLFSAGIIFYQFVTGENPFDGRTMATVMHKVLSQEPLEPYKLNLQVSMELNLVIKQAIAKRLEDRFQNAEAFSRAIAEAFNANPSSQEKQSSESIGGFSKTVIISEPIAEKVHTTSTVEPQTPYDPYKTFVVTPPQLETAIPTGDSVHDSRSIAEKPEAVPKHIGLPPRFKWAILCGVIALLLAGMALRIDRLTKDKTDAIANIEESRPTVVKLPVITNPSETVSDESKLKPDKKNDPDLSEKTETVKHAPVETKDTKSGTSSGGTASEPAPLKKQAKKTSGKENVMADKDNDLPPQTADAINTEESKEKSDTTRKDSSATAASKPKRHSCKEIYLKISLGEKLTAEEQRIINNCR